ncbi:MAG TPA: radical SAM protein [Thermoplasmatales archaeon]|nr:radical SAM protein [Thermoplasmatales archaeon]
MFTVGILDGYVDEPTCLGVPPYISTYPRYIAGAVWKNNPSNIVKYYTIDQVRRNPLFLRNIKEVDLLVVIAGMVVPGRYLSGTPIDPGEIRIYLGSIKKPIKLLCGPAAKHGFGVEGGLKPKSIEVVERIFNGIVKGDSETVIYSLLNQNLELEAIDLSEKRKNEQSIREYAILGASIIKQHPFYPDALIAEIETYRGCPRSITGGCSFCIEPLHGKPDFRPMKDIHDEIKALSTNGLRHIRLGNQPCIFSYKAYNAGREEFPRPNPRAIEELFKGIHEVTLGFKTIHIDNANPGVIARYPEESREIAEIIIRYHTPGDVAAFGVESVDPKVIEENNLKASEEEVLEAIRILNEVGAKKGWNGMPELLPGINLLFGLKGETSRTFKLNYRFLKRILEEKLLIRRINLRQVIPLMGTPMNKIGDTIMRRHHELFKRFKRKVKEEVEKPLLRNMLPVGTILREVFTETVVGKTTFGRQIGSYPLLVGIIGVYDLHRFMDVTIIDYGYRSVTAIPYPLHINTAPREAIEALPGIGEKRAWRIITHRPIRDKKHLIDVMDDPGVASSILPYISFQQ